MNDNDSGREHVAGVVFSYIHAPPHAQVFQPHGSGCKDLGRRGS